MNEAARCDRIALMDSGRVLAYRRAGGTRRRRAASRRWKTPSSPISRRRPGARAPPAGARVRLAGGRAAGRAPPRPGSACGGCWPTRSARALELLRDPIRLGFSLFGTAFLMLVFGFGISTDVNNLSFAVLDRDKTPGEPRLSRRAARLDLFHREAAAHRLRRSGEPPAQRRRSRRRSKSRPDFGRDIKRGRPGLRSAPGSTARCRSAPRRSAAISQACTRSISPIPRSRRPRPRSRRPPTSRSASNTIRISTSSTRWCPRRWR